MKKTVKSRADLNKTALKTGATITSKGGARFNSGAKKSKVIKKAIPKKKEVKPEQSLLIAQAVEKQTSELRMLLEGLKEQMAAIKIDHPEPITAWDFDLIRNKDGSVKTIQARVPARVLN